MSGPCNWQVEEPFPEVGNADEEAFEQWCFNERALLAEGRMGGREKSGVRTRS